MAKMARYCARCNEVHPAGTRCPLRVDKRQHDHRYDEAEYRRNRQSALERTGGKCKRCGRKIAYRDDGGTWKCVGGSVHHMTPLSKGGAHNVSNLVPLCDDCHLAFHPQAKRVR